MLHPAIRGLLGDLDLPCDPDTCARLEQHARLVREWSPSAGLVSKRDRRSGGLTRHYLESIRGLPYLGKAKRVVDLGSGAGFPGLVWAVLRPDLEVVAVESSPRRAAFLRQAAHEMGLPGVVVLAERISGPERLVAAGADLLTSRASGASHLLLESGRLPTTQPVRIVLYAGGEKANRVQAGAPEGYRLVALVQLEPAGEGPAGALVVLDRDVPRGTSS